MLFFIGWDNFNLVWSTHSVPNLSLILFLEENSQVLQLVETLSSFLAIKRIEEGWFIEVGLSLVPLGIIIEWKIVTCLALVS